MHPTLQTQTPRVHEILRHHGTPPPRKAEDNCIKEMLLPLIERVSLSFHRFAYGRWNYRQGLLPPMTHCALLNRAKIHSLEISYFAIGGGASMDLAEEEISSLKNLMLYRLRILLHRWQLCRHAYLSMK